MTTLPNRPGHPAPQGSAPARPGQVAFGGDPHPGPRRDDDRRVVVASVAIAIGYLAAAAIAAVGLGVPGSTLAPWVPLHLALAGGASTAIAGVMPFFAATLVAGHPADRRVRAWAVALVAGGAAIVSVRGLVPVWTALPPIGGVVFLGGIGLTAVALRTAGRRGLMVRRPIVTLAYTLALGNVALGAMLGTLYAANWLPVVERWALLKPAHAWTNLIGFVSLVIVGTLLHFLPTVLGSRIVARRSAILAVLGVALGSPLVVVGLALGWSPVAGGGAMLSALGAWSLVMEAVWTIRARGRWTTDPGWHRVSAVGLSAGSAWFAIGVIMAAARVLSEGATGDAWSTPLVGVPLAIGWVVQVLIGSWTHLIPAVGPGGPVLHARRRAILGRLATLRVVALNAGVGLACVGWPGSIVALAVAGLVLVAVSVLASVTLAVIALRAKVPAQAAAARPASA